MTQADTVPEKTQVVVIGGGPGGSYAASCLAREGVQVVVLEAEKFPRYHVGESQLASLRHFLRFIDLEKEFEEYGFNKKVGAAFKLNKDKTEGFTDFIAVDKKNYSWNVTRSESDALMLQHSRNSGASVFEETKVTSVDFEGVGVDSRPVSVTWKNNQGATGKIAFDYVVDASGRNGILSTKYLNTRKFNNSLKNIACWGYWRNSGMYKPGTPRAGSPFFEALSDESGWAWLIPLRGGKTSVGIVMNQEISNQKKAQMPSELKSLRGHYLEELSSRAPAIKELLAQGTLIEDEGTVVRSASDYSYHATSYAGLNYRIVGDAGAFIDPYFSSGVHLALSGGLSAAASICSSMRGDCLERDAAEWHTSRVGISYTRFLIVVLSAYRQIRAQEAPVLADIDEDNFDRAFDHFRPIIQGNADTQSAKKLSEDELRQTIDFCTSAFAPSSAEEKSRVEELVLQASGNGTAAQQTMSEDPEAKRIEARKLMRTSDTLHIDAFVSDDINGLHLKLKRGQLGLERS